jgi:hypothetical protein
MQACKKCKKEFPLTSFQKGNRKFVKCEICRQKEREKIKAKNEEKKKDMKEDEQLCRFCKIIYPIESFVIGKTGKRLKTCKYCDDNKKRKIQEKTKDMKENEKLCITCNKILDIEKFKIRLNGERQSKCIDCNKYMLEYLEQNRCPHGNMNKSACKECGGKSICEHGRTRTYCVDCGGGSMCEHKKRKDRCEECADLYGRHQYCEHNRLKTSCHDCVGGSICEHGTRRTRCVECEGGTICEHKIPRGRCRICDFAGFLASIVSSRVYEALKSSNSSKSKRSIEYLGTDIITYKKYLESRFVEGMNWDNYGTVWEIDHIVPIKYQNPTIEEVEQRLHYKNTQPLWAKLNASKNNRYIFELVATADCSDNNEEEIIDNNNQDTVESEINSAIC